MAEMYNISVADYAAVRQYCQSFVLFIDCENFENGSAIGIDPTVFPSAQVGVRIIPNPGCGVESVRFREDGFNTKTSALYRDDATGEVTACFDLPNGNMTVTITVTHPETVTSKVEAFAGAKMTQAEIPTGCTLLGDRAFMDCEELTEIRIPADCALGEDVFAGCGLVYVFAVAGSPAETYCLSHGSCMFVPVE